MPSAMLKAVYNAVNQKQDRELIDAIKSGLSYLKDGIKEIVEDKIEIEKPHKIVNIVQKDSSLWQTKPRRTGNKNTNTRSNGQQITNYFSSIKSRKLFRNVQK